MAYIRGGMQSTEMKKSNQTLNAPNALTQPTASKSLDKKPSAEKYQLQNLSMRTATRLESCMESLAKDETVESVKAICMCASELNKIMKLNLDFYKEGL